MKDKLSPPFVKKKSNCVDLVQDYKNTSLQLNPHKSEVITRTSIAAEGGEQVSSDTAGGTG